MDATLYTGTTAYPQTVTNQLGFKPDLVWAKSRSNAYYNGLFDSNRSGYALYSNTTDVEDTGEQVTFNTNGFSTPNKSADFINTNAATYVAWQWKANGSSVSNTSGTITSQVNANTAAGFSVITYTGNGSNSQTIGHGLGVTPQFVIFKCRSNNESWNVYHVSIPAGYDVRLNATNGLLNENNYNTFTSSVLSVNGNDPVNHSAWTYVAYCWAPVAGFSQFGSYTGNGSNDGPFVYTGFRPKFLMFKRTDTTGDWGMYDTSRDPYNLSYHLLRANTSAVEDTGNVPLVTMDLLSNGIKFRGTWSDMNASGGTYIYMAFAENPFKYANAR